MHGFSKLPMQQDHKLISSKYNIFHVNLKMGAANPLTFDVKHPMG
jgi:hypothetical protein